MLAALRGSYVEFVTFNGVTEKYPLWFEEELHECTFTDESRYTFWVPDEERRADYYEKQLIEDYSVFIRKPNGEVHLTDWDVFSEMYTSFRYDKFTNSGIAAFNEDVIEYVELQPGIFPSKEYPLWFYEYFTEAVNMPNQFEGYILLSNKDEIEVDIHCVVLRNKFGELKVMPYYDMFLKYYDDNPVEGGLWTDGF